MATSGTVYSGYGDESRYYVTWSRTGTWNDDTCGSNIKWDLYLDNGNWWYTNALKVYTIYINGTAVYSGGTFSNKTTQGAVWLAGGTTTIQHSNDGTKTFNINFKGWFYSSINVSASKDFTLDTIPRASSFGSIDGVTLGSDMTININRNSDSFTHSLWYSMGSKTLQAIGTSIETSKTFTLPLSLASEIPDDTVGVITLILRTYNGSTQVGSDVYASYKVYVPSTVVPSISELSVSEATSGLADQFEAYVQYKSKLKIDITAAGSYGSTIKSYSTKVGSTTYTGSSFTTGTMNSSGSVTITTTVTDSRGRTTEDSTTVTIVAYYNPKATKITVERCLSDGTIDGDGTYASIAYAYDIASVNSKNSKSAKIQYLNGSTWTDLASYTDYSGSGTYVSTKTFSSDSGWDFRLVVADYFATTYNYDDISTGFTLMNYNADGTAVAFGKVSEISNTVEFGLETVHYEQPTFKKGYKVTGTNTIASTSEDTVDTWVALGNSVHYYSALDQINEQPSQWGFLLNFSNDINNISQLWRAQANGSLYHRGGNANGLGSWKTVLDSANYSSYALPITGGTVNGGLGVDGYFQVNNAYASIGYYRFATEWIGMYASAADATNNTNRKGYMGFNGSNDFAIVNSSGGNFLYNGNEVLTMATQNVLWSSSGSYMNASQSVTLSQAVSAQRNGIVLVWSDYSNSTGQDWDFYCHFIPKQFVALKSGRMISMGVMSTTGFGTVGTKAVYISDTTITGHDDNDNTTQTSSSTITYNNSKWVLRMVIGV